MSIRELLKMTSHRPWKIPNENWKFYQEWNNVIFLHWQVDIEELKKFVPKELEIDLFNGKPWISIVAFTMENIRPRNLPPFPPISNFDEVNIRTYVKSNDKTGVYFLNIEGGNFLSCKVAKAISELPYTYSKIKRRGKIYESKNREQNNWLNIEFTVGEEIREKDEIDSWLTERYALFHVNKRGINEFEIQHIEWPIKEISIQNLEFQYSKFEKIFRHTPTKIQYSNGVEVIAWGKKIRKTADPID